MRESPPLRWLTSRLSTPVQRVLSNSGWLILERMLRLALAVIVGAWVARYLGPAAYGQMAYTVAITAMFQAVATLGLDGIVVRNIAQHPQHASMQLGSALRLRLVAGVFGWCATVLMVCLLRPGDSNALWLALILGSGLVLGAAEVVDLWFQSQSRSRRTVPPRVVAYLVVGAAKVALVQMQAPLWAFVAAVPAEAALVAVALWLAYRSDEGSATWCWQAAQARRMLAESWPLLLSALSIAIYMRIDQVMLREMAGDEALGLYSVVLPFSQAWHLIPMTICASAMPRLAQLRQTDEAGYWRRLQQLSAALAWAGIAAAVLTASLAPWLVRSLLGPEFAPAADVLRWHALTNVFVFLGVAQGVAIVNERTPFVALAKTLCGVVVSIAMNAWLIPSWGAVGAAWAALTSYMVSAVLSNAVLAPRMLRLQMNAVFRPFHA